MDQRIDFTLPDGSLLTHEKGLSLLTIAQELQSRYLSPIVAFKLNNELHDLSFVPESGGKLMPIDLSVEDGVRIYSRSLTLVLIKAASDLFPNCKVRIEHSLSKGIYGEIDFENKQPFTEKECAQIARKMREIIQSDLPIAKETVPLAQAIAHFERQGQLDKVRLFRFKQTPEVHLCHCADFTGYFYGYMLPSTGYLRQFELKYYLHGFILLFPGVSDPTAVPEFVEQRKLARVFYEFERWGKILEVGDVGSLNLQIAAGKGGELVRIAEALHEKKIAQIADMIAKDRERIRTILIAGPSSSGKTTFAQRLSVQLRVNGLKPISISIDDFFVDRRDTPIGPDGLPDFESLDAIDVRLFNQCLTSLIHGVPVQLPQYNFQQGQREWRPQPIQISADQPIIIEGIHGLNDKLTADIPKHNKFKIYVSALTQLNIDDHNRIPTTDNRIIRRIVRDNQFRGHDALTTIGLWPMVRRGEEKHIFPYQEEADVMFNSALVYELAVLKHYAEPLLEKITTAVPEYTEAKRLLKFLSYFMPLDDSEVPPNSIIREFIGNSCFVK
jgi:uridine kinase